MVGPRAPSSSPNAKHRELDLKALVGIGASNIVPLLFSAAARSETVAPSAAIAMAATVGYAGFLLGPPMIGFAADHIGLRLALGTLLLAVVLIAGSAYRVTAGRGNREE